MQHGRTHHPERAVGTAAELPGGDIEVLVVVPQRLPVLGLGLGSEVTSTRLTANNRGASY